MRTLILCALMLSGCAAVETPLDDDYRLGDTAGSVLSLQAQYCDTADPYRRAVILALMHKVGVPLPPNGVCTDVWELIHEDRVSQPAPDNASAK